MPERPSFTPEARRTRFDLSSIMGIAVEEVVIPATTKAKAEAMFARLEASANEAQMAEAA